MDDASTIEPQPELAAKPEAKHTLSFLWGGLALIVVSLGISGYALWTVHKANERMDGLFYSQTASDYTHDNDLLSPDIGTMQFMRRGYSIRFDSLTYGQNGLLVTGTVGNATQLTLSSLTLKLSARPFLYKMMDRIEKDPFLLFGTDYEIGSGQTSIGYLPPGKTESFSMTIPNVKQISDDFKSRLRLRVSATPTSVASVKSSPYTAEMGKREKPTIFT
jgi:hypothetical protein